MSKIEIRNLTKRYGAATALENVSLTIDTGEFLVLLGPSGCGKTTLLRSLAGLETPDQGEIAIDGEIVFSSEKNLLTPPGKRNLGMVFQSYALWPHMTVRDNIKFGLDVLKMPKAAAEERIGQVLADLGMTPFIERYPSELSGGQQQRVALARLLATQPPVFLMDEPLSNLDARLRMDMRVELKRIQAVTGATTVYVTHDQTEAMTMSTQVVVMREGRIQQASPPGQLYRHPANIFVADFVGMPRINLIHLAEEPGGEGSVYGNGDIRLDLGRRLGVAKIVLGARPEDLVISPDPTRDAEDFQVTSVLPNGPEIILQLTRGETSLMARTPLEMPVETGMSVWVTYKSAALNIYDAANGELIELDHANETEPSLQFATGGRK